jgi:ATP-dependent RNA helicase DeaD
MERFRIEVGHQHDVKPGNIVGAIANEAGLDAQHIGHIDIHTDFSVVDLPSGMPNDVFQDLRKAWVCGQRLDISRLEKPGKKKKSEQKAKKSKKRSTITLSKPREPIEK